MGAVLKIGKLSAPRAILKRQIEADARVVTGCGIT